MLPQTDMPSSHPPQPWPLLLFHPPQPTSPSRYHRQLSHTYTSSQHTDTHRRRDTGHSKRPNINALSYIPPNHHPPHHPHTHPSLNQTINSSLQPLAIPPHSHDAFPSSHPFILSLPLSIPRNEQHRRIESGKGEPEKRETEKKDTYLLCLPPYHPAFQREGIEKERHRRRSKTLHAALP